MSRTTPLLRAALATGVALSALVLPAPIDAQDDELEGVGFTLGAGDAPITVVEYGDFACSACAEFFRDTWPEIRARYVDTGRVRWRMIPFELGFRNSDEGARAGQCGADQGAFWRMHDVLYERQAEWEGERRPKDILIALAVSIGLDEDRFRECYDDDWREDFTKDANRAARREGVRATPTFLIDGVPVQGALPVATFAELLERALAGR